MTQTTWTENERAARSNLFDFTCYTYPGYAGNWHHRLICSYLDRFVAGEITRLMIFAPPRSGKSELVSRRLPAYILGKYPDTTIIATSYGADLARRMNRDVQRIMDDDAYRRLFPGSRLFGSNVRTVAQGSWLRNSDMFEVVGRRGYYLGTGVGGSITGSGAHCLVGETKISTEIGDIAINHLVMLQYRPRVWAFDHKTNAPVLRRVVAVKESYSDDILEIVTVSGRSIRATSEHRFYVQGRGYQAAALLRPGDKLQAFTLEQDMLDMRESQGRQRHNVPGLLHASEGGQGIANLCVVRQGVRSPLICARKGHQTRNEGCVLLQGLCPGSPRSKKRIAMQALRQGHAGETGPQVLFRRMRKSGAPTAEIAGSHLSLVRSDVHPPSGESAALLADVRRCCTFAANAWSGELELQDGDQLRQVVRRNAPFNHGAGRSLLRSVPEQGSDRSRHMEGAAGQPHDLDNSPHQRRPHRQYPGKHGHLVQDVPCRTPQIGADAVALVKRLRTGKIPVYDLQVEEDHNFFAADVLTHNCVIIDDPVKNRKEANSPTYRETVFDWYTSTLYTRLTPDGRVLLTVTRWHEDDLAGKLLALAKSDPESDQWTTLILPALSEDPVARYDERRVAGKALWENRWGIEKLRTIERTVGSRDWASLYQQRPSPDEGEIFKRHHWRYWQPRGANLPPVTVTMADSSVIEVEAIELPARFDELLQSWDCTFKDTSASDFVAGQVLGRLGADKFLLDYTCERLATGI
jgi:hypothetical protein